MRIARRGLIGWAAGLAGWRAAHAADAEALGRIVRLQGVAWAIRTEGIVPLGAGDLVHVTDIVRTGPDAKLLIRCGGGLELFIGSGTELALRSYLPAPGGGIEAFFGLLRGIVRLVSDPGGIPHTVEVDGPTALASVRGTVWVVEATPAGTAVLALEGEVIVRGFAGGAVVLGPGEGTDVPPGQPPGATVTWGAARREAAIARTSF